MDERRRFHSLMVQEIRGHIILGNFGDPRPKAEFKYIRPEPDRLSLDGSYEGQSLRVELARIDHSKLPLISRGFHWINEYPYNR